MPRIVPDRRTHDHDGDLVLFLIGMRINKPWRPDLWLAGRPGDAPDARRAVA